MAGLLSPASIPASMLPPPRDAVAETLRRWAELPFVWGATDCFQSGLAYAERVTGRVFEGREPYDGPFSAARGLLRWGGFEAYCAHVFAALECPAIAYPARGDLGLVNLPTTDLAGCGLALCLCTGDFWAARGERQVVFSRAAPVAAWRVLAPQIVAEDENAGGAQCLR